MGHKTGTLWQSGEGNIKDIENSKKKKKCFKK